MLILISIYLPSPVPTDRRRCSYAGCSSNDCPCVHTTPPQTHQTQHLPPPRSEGDQEVAPESWGGHCINLVIARCNIQCGYSPQHFYRLQCLAETGSTAPAAGFQDKAKVFIPSWCHHDLHLSVTRPTLPTSLCDDASNGAGFVWQNWVIRCWECQEDKSQNKLLSDEWFNWSIW